MSKPSGITANHIQVSVLRHRLLLPCTQAEKQHLEEQLINKTADASTLQFNLQQSITEYQKLNELLGDTQAELESSVEQTQKANEELQKLGQASAARQADLAAELERSKAQASQLGRQLSERIQRLDVLQVILLHVCTYCLPV